MKNKTFIFINGAAFTTTPVNKIIENVSGKVMIFSASTFLGSIITAEDLSKKLGVKYVVKECLWAEYENITPDYAGFELIDDFCSKENGAETLILIGSGVALISLTIRIEQIFGLKIPRNWKNVNAKEVEERSNTINIIPLHQALSIKIEKGVDPIVEIIDFN